jgi:hypothetical protein
MSLQYSFNTYTGEAQTSTNTFPLRLAFDDTQISPLLIDFGLKIEGEFSPKIFLQGGPGMSTHTAATRKISGNFKIPVRVTQAKELEQIASKFIDFTFFDNGSTCLPQMPKYFSLETAYYKTSNSWLTPPGKAYQNFNEDFMQVLINRCLIGTLSIDAKAGSTTELSADFKGTISKTVDANLFTEESTIDSVNNSFAINKVLGLQDSRVLINGSHVPNCNGVSFTIQREIVEKQLSRSVNISYSPNSYGYVGSNATLNYSNDFTSKIGVKSFIAKITIKQVLRRIDENLYFSRGGKGSAAYSGVNFIDVYFGPIKISRPCSLLQQSEQPFGVGLIERSNTFLLLNRPKIVKEDFLSIITGGVW